MTIQQPMDIAGVPWYYYAPPIGANVPYWNTISAVSAIYNGADWARDVDTNNFITDIGNNKFTSSGFAAWITPTTSTTSIHRIRCRLVIPGSIHRLRDPGSSQYWSHALITLHGMTLEGLRIMSRHRSWTFMGWVRVSRWSSSHPIRSRVYQPFMYTSDSILAEIEQTLNVPCMGLTDCGANNLSDFLPLRSTWS